MKAILTDLLAIIGVVLNGLPQGLLALTFGFASVPTALACFVGAVGNTITQSVAPISFQAETITYAGTAGKDRSERCTMIFIGGVIMALIGVFGQLTKIVNFVGEDVAYGMMAGVGISNLDATTTSVIVGNKVTKSYSEQNFTWAVGGGISAQVTTRINADIGYRFWHMGDIEHASVRAHEFYIGARYVF